ncbi:MAG TPA: hypothetical protein VFH48_25820 [Chloroflexota bacterium]|nr:hypothetical protein [Chloroflexota bacterium]
MAAEHAQTIRPDEALREIRQRLISIHYGLAEGPLGDRELQKRARDRLMELLEYVNAIIPPSGVQMTDQKRRRPGRG